MDPKSVIAIATEMTVVLFLVGGSNFLPITGLFDMLPIQYRREFADPFWNSQEQNMLTYVFMLMTSWAIVCDVYYLEPTRIAVSLCV